MEPMVDDGLQAAVEVVGSIKRVLTCYVLAVFDLLSLREAALLPPAEVLGGDRRATPPSAR